MPKNSDINYIDGYDHRKLERLYQNHSQLEAAVVADLAKMGFVVHSAPYHKYMEQEAQKILHSNFEINGIYIRSRADRIILHKESGFACQLEIKTARFNHYEPVMFLEALPLAIHVHNSRIGIKTLFVYGDPNKKTCAAFWANHDIIQFIKEIRIPPKERVNRTYYEGKFKLIFGESLSAKVILTDRMPRSGSGDPYAVIDLQGLLKRQYVDMEHLLYDEIALHKLFRSSPDKPMLCGYCAKEVNFLDMVPDPEQGSLILATFCLECKNAFCNRLCSDNHFSQGLCLAKRK